jgi:hypothetical protein
LYNKGTLLGIYHKYIREVFAIQDIERWSIKKTISTKLLESERKNETKVVDALKGKKLQEGDKFKFYNAIDGEVQKVEKGKLVFSREGEPKMIPNRVLRLIDEYCPESVDKLHYVERIYKTFDIFKNVIDMQQFVKYHNKSNVSKLEKLIGG